MRLTIHKYFLKSWTLPFVGALVFYGGLLMAWEVVAVSKEIFSMGAPFRWLVPILLLAMPENLGYVLPMAAVLGGLMGMQHLAEGSELVAAQGLGVGMRAVLKPWILLAVVLIGLASLNVHVVVPWASMTQRVAKIHMVEEAQARYLRPGAAPWFPAARPTTAVWIDPRGQVHLMEVNDTSVQHLIAASIAWSQPSNQSEKPTIGVKMKDIKGCIINRSDGSIVNMREQEHLEQFEVPSIPRLVRPTEARLLRSRELWRQSGADATIEWARRICIPIASCALLLLGIALGLGHPRFQRGGALLKSLGIILVYYVLLKYFENLVLSTKGQRLFPCLALYLLPWSFLAAGFMLLRRRLHPHVSNRWVRCLPRPVVHRLDGWWHGLSSTGLRIVAIPFKKVASAIAELKGRRRCTGVLAQWTSRLWWRNWGGVLGTMLALSLLIDYASLAGDMSKNHVGMTVFLHYWLWNLPPFLAVVLPVAFLMGGVLGLSDAAVTREWVALRAGGTSLVRWCRSGFRAWGSVLVLTFVLQAVVAPFAFRRQDVLYQRILARPARIMTSKPWLHLGSTGMIWFLDRDQRWGFPMKPAGEAYALLSWKMGSPRTEGLPWGGLTFEEGPRASVMFPDQALRTSSSAEDTMTLDLFQWQKWAPDPDRATMLWLRLLNWLAGPCLLFAMLPSAFPSPRGGRGTALGLSLVAGLVFVGLQALLTGAAKAGDLPPLLGVLGPMALLVAFGLIQLHRLRT